MGLFDRIVRRATPFSSGSYWRERYKQADNSGDGSYGVLAQDKAEFLNAFIRQHDIRSVIEFGVGDGNQLQLAEYPAYLGVDISPEVIRRCTNMHPDKSFLCYDPLAWSNRGFIQADLALSLDVLYHLVEEDVYERYLEHLFASATSYVIIYSPDAEERVAVSHVRPRRFTPDVARWFPEWSLESETRAKRYVSSYSKAGPERTPCSFFVYRKGDQ